MNTSSDTQTEPDFYTARKFAEKAEISYQTVLRLIVRGKLKCNPDIRHKRIPASELARWKRGEF